MVSLGRLEEVVRIGALNTLQDPQAAQADKQVGSENEIIVERIRLAIECDTDCARAKGDNERIEQKRREWNGMLSLDSIQKKHLAVAK